MNLLKFFPLMSGAISTSVGINQNDERKAIWRLVWQDEFNYGTMPDPAKWNYEVGFLRNKEAQYYTKGAFSNVRIENRSLLIEGQKELFRNPAYVPGSDDWRKASEFASYTSCSLTTQGLASWRYGRIEVRAKIPTGKGAWPAIWMLGENKSDLGWPLCGEIDIMENVGWDPDRIHGTVHYPDVSKEKGYSSCNGNFLAEKPYDAFHVYALEWDSEKMDFYYDRLHYHRFLLDEAGTGPDNPFRKPFFLIINLAIGGAWGGEIDDSIFPLKYWIDYVRVYERLN